MFDTTRTSWLQWARANDDEMARRELELRKDEGAAGEKKKAQPTIETFEWTPTVELLAQLLPLMQQLIHAVHTHQTKAAKRKPRITLYPTPTTALKRVKGAEKRDAFATVESVIQFSDDPYGPDSGNVRYSNVPADAPPRPARPNQLRPRRAGR
jgi:hypothetical protein